MQPTNNAMITATISPVIAAPSASTGSNDTCPDVAPAMNGKYNKTTNNVNLNLPTYDSKNGTALMT